MKRFAVLAAILGLALFAAVLAYSGLGDVAEAVAAAGWATALVVLARAAAIIAEGVAWQLLFPPGQVLATGPSVLIRFIREAVNQLLPVGQVGGDFVGARVATFFRCDGALAGATIFADVAVQAATQFLFALLGVAILFTLKGDGELVRYAALGLALGAVAIAAFLLIQRGGTSAWLGAALRRVSGGREWLGVAAIERLYAKLALVYQRPGRVATSAVIHLVVWILGSVEVWVALRFMGHPVTYAEAIVIESLAQAVRGAAFAVPGGLGVQEGGFIALCSLFGVPPGPAVALSLLKRVADLALGLPFLAVWQALEGRRAFGAPVAEPPR